MSSKSFFPIKVKSIDKSTKDAVVIEFDIPEEIQADFTYIQGQYLTLKKDINGQDIRRSYSLCSSPEDKKWKVGIKKIYNGIFSTYANETLAVGDTLEVMPPQGRFFIDLEPQSANNYVAFAAGSGITPILSIIKTHLLKEPNSEFKLFYTNKTAGSIMLKEELEALKNQFMERFEIFYFLTKEKRNIPFLNGRVDSEKLETIFTQICYPKNVDAYFLCGPEAMIQLIDEFLKSHDVDKSKIHFELFNTGNNQSEKIEQLKKTFEGKRSCVTILEGGKSFEFEMEQGSNNVLDEALNNSADLPFACKGGVCATCKAKLVEGEVDMLLSYGLEDDEVEAGYVLTCQAIPTTEKVIVDFDI